jgi:hypothetical protein
MLSGVAEETVQSPLPYARPDADPRPFPSPLWAVLLCAPALVCWCAYIMMIFRRWIPPGMRGVFGRLFPMPSPWLLACCGAAVVTAIASLLLYGRARKTWYVALNLLVNAGWLFMTICLAAIIAFVFYRAGR